MLFAAAYSAQGRARDLIVAAPRGQAIIVMSPLVLEETERNLRRKQPLALPVFELVCSALATRLVSPSEAQVQRAAGFVHLKDAAIVAGALAGGTRFLATYDRKHLLKEAKPVAQGLGVRIATPDDILAELGLAPDPRRSGQPPA